MRAPQTLRLSRDAVGSRLRPGRRRVGEDGAERDVRGWQAPGSTGCNRFTASYTVAGDALEIGPIASTRMACPPPADSVERDYVAALEQVRAWRVENEELMLVDADETEVLRYQAATPSGSWQATGFLQGGAIKSLIAGTEITASFDSSGTLSGSAGCNTYRAMYTTDGDGIEIGPARSDRDGMRVARRDHGAGGGVSRRLPTAVRYRVGGRSLELLSAEGTIVVTYTRVPES